MDEFSSNIGVRKSFLIVARNPDVVKEKIDTFDYIKLITFTWTLLAWQTKRATKDPTLSIIKTQMTKWEKTFAKYFKNKGLTSLIYGLSQWIINKESLCNAGDLGSIPGSGRSPGGGNGDPLQCFCPENPMDRGPWWATVHRVTKSQTWLKGLSLHP